MKKNDGGPAHPHYYRDMHPSMSLRDAMAIAALPAIMTDIIKAIRDGATNVDPGITLAQLVARESYVYADAMIAEREK